MESYRSKTALIATGAALALSGCNCEGGQGLSRVYSDAVPHPAELDFGDVLVGTTKTLMLDVTNPGDIALEVCLAEGRTCSAVTRVEPMGGPFAAELGVAAGQPT